MKLTDEKIHEVVEKLKERGISVITEELKDEYGIVVEDWDTQAYKHYEYGIDDFGDVDCEIVTDDQDWNGYHSKDASILDSIISFVKEAEEYMKREPKCGGDDWYLTEWKICSKYVKEDVDFIKKELLSYDYSHYFPEPFKNVWAMTDEELKAIPLCSNYLYSRNNFGTNGDPKGRDLPFLKYGQKVEVHTGKNEWRKGRIMGYQRGLFVLVEGYPNNKSLAGYHPWGNVRYFTDDGELICEFKDGSEPREVFQENISKAKSYSIKLGIAL